MAEAIVLQPQGLHRWKYSDGPTSASAVSARSSNFVRRRIYNYPMDCDKTTPVFVGRPNILPLSCHTPFEMERNVPLSRAKLINSQRCHCKQKQLHLQQPKLASESHRLI